MTTVRVSLRSVDTIDPETREAVERLRASFAEAAKQAEKLTRPFREAMMELAERFAPDVERLYRVAKWAETAPEALRVAVGESGLFVPAEHMTLHDLYEITQAFEQDGTEAAINRLSRQYGTVFGDPAFIGRRVDQWKTDPLFRRRAQIVDDAIEAHRLGLYGASIPTFLAQFEGILTETMDPIPGRPTYADLRATGAEVGASHSVTAPLFSAMLSTLWTQFVWGEALPPFGRHAIQHGADTEYATERRSQTAILLLDHLFLLRSRRDDSTE